MATSRYNAKAKPSAKTQADDTGFDPSAIAGSAAPVTPPMAAYGTGPNSNSESQTGLIDQANQNRQSSNARGDAINSELTNQVNDYAGQQARYRSQADAAAQQLQETPGYNDAEAAKIGADYGQNKTTQAQLDSNFLPADAKSAILGNTRSDMGYYNPDQLTNETQAANSSLGGATQQLQSGLNSSFDPNQLSESGQYAGQVNGALADQNRGINESLGAERTGLNAAVDPGKLGVTSDYLSQEKMTPQQQADIVAAAGTTVGNQYQASKDALQRNAAAEGNTSPAAIAAATDRLNNDSAAKSGEAMTQARIDASNAAATRAQSIQNTQLGANQDISSRQMNNAQTMGTQGVNAVQNLSAQEIAANQAMENTRLGANQDVANRQMTAAQVGGQAGINTAQAQGQNTLNTDKGNQATGQALEQQAESADSSRAGQVATNTQATQQQNNATQYNQGMATQAANSQGAQTTGNARIAGNNSYLGYQTGQQAAAQTGQATATGQQVANYGTQAGAANTATSTASQAAATKAGQPSTFDKIAGVVTNAAKIGFAEDGGVFTRPTPVIIGEHGPEQVVPLGGQMNQGASVDDMQNSGEASVSESPYGKPSGPQMSAWQKLKSKAHDLGQSQQQSATASPQRYGQQKPASDAQPVTAGSGWGNLGSAIGTIGANYMEDGGIATQPTPVMLGENGPEQVVPLGGQQSQQTQQPPTYNGMPSTSQGMAQQPAQQQPMGQGMGQSQAPPQQPGQQAPQPQPDQQSAQPPASGFSKPPRYPNTAPAGSPDPAKSMPGTQTGQPNQPQRYASGGMITKPTLAIIGENGPEAVVPMNPTAQSKITPSIINSGPNTIGPSARARYRHPSGPSGNHGPMHALNVLRPGMAAR